IPVAARPLKLEPRVTVGRVGSMVSIKNEDKPPRTFYLKDGESYMPREATAPGATREVKLTEKGEYVILDADNASASSTVVVVDTPYHAHADEKGTFSI